MDEARLSQIISRLRAQGTDDGSVEVKSCATSLSESIWRAVSAFANTRGGTLLLGVSEAGGFTPIVDFALDRVLDQFVDGMGRANESGGKVTNPPSFEVSRVTLDGHQVLVVEIGENAPTAKPCFVTARGITNGSFRRIDDKNVLLTPSELFELQHVFAASTADRDVVPEATLDDLDPGLVAALTAARQGSKALTGVSDERERLRRLNVVDSEGRVRMAALLTLGRYPQQFFPRLLVDVVHHPTAESASADRQLRFLDRVECEGPLGEVVDAAVAAISRNLRTYSVVEGVGRRDHLEIPVGVLREAVANAVLHREYHPLFQGQPVTVDIHPDRVVITSPGGLWGGKTVDTLDDGQSRCRNQTLLQLLKQVPLPGDAGRAAEGEGGGVPLMNRLMAAEALDRPDYQGTSPDHVEVVLRRHGVEVPEVRRRLREALPRPALPAEEIAVAIAQREGHVNVAMLHAALGADSDEVRAVLRTLLADGVLHLQGPEDYVLVRGVAPKGGRAYDVLNVLSESEPLALRDIAAATGSTVAALRPVLRSLVADGRVTPTAPTTSRHRRYLRKG